MNTTTTYAPAPFLLNSSAGNRGRVATGDYLDFPLLYAFWAAFHPSEFMVNFELFAPLTLENFTNAWSQAPFARYYLNTFALVTGVVIGQFIVCTLAAFAFARFPIPGKTFCLCWC